MASYKVVIVPSVEKDFRRLSQEVARRLWRRVRELETTLFPHGAVKLEGKPNSYRISAGDYRIVYTVDADNHIVFVVRVRHRREVYRNL